RKSRAYLLRRLTAITVFLQISHRPKRPAALADGALKQSLGQRRSDQRINAPRTRRFADDGHATGIATQGRDALLPPLQSRDMSQHGIIARGVVWRLGGQCGMSEIAEGVETIVDRHQNDPFFRQSRPVVGASGA